MEYLRRSNLGHLLFDNAEEDDEEFAWGPRQRRRQLDPNRFPKVPSEKGTELMNSGTFGASEKVSSNLRSKKRLARRILDRELGIGNRTGRRVNQGMIAQVRKEAHYILGMRLPLPAGNDTLIGLLANTVGTVYGAYN